MKYYSFLTVALPLLCVSSVFAAPKNADFKGIARLHTLTSKGKNYTAKSVYPTFRGTSPLVRFVNTRIKSAQRQDFSQWLVKSKQLLKEDPKPIGPYEFESNPVLNSFQPPRIVSLRLDTYQYLGGAHGGAYLENHNFALVNGRPKELTLGDLFTPGTDYRKLAKSKILASLKKNPAAMWIEDGSVKTVTDAQLKNFALSKGAVTWMFQEYEMGPYANGPIEAKVLVSELGPNFKRSLLPH